jgi:SAM-dependent methyltransferase
LDNRWDEKYRSGYGTGGTAEPLLVDAVAGLRPGRALDLACGLGRNALYLAERGWHVTALDYSAVAIDSLRGPSIDARVVDLEDPAFQLPDSQYDLIVDVLYLKRSLFSQIRTALKPGGMFVGVMAMFDDDAPMNADYLCAPDELRMAFSDWTIHHYREGKNRRRNVAEIVAERPEQIAGATRKSA